MSRPSAFCNSFPVDIRYLLRLRRTHEININNELTFLALISCVQLNWVSCVVEFWNFQNCRQSSAIVGVRRRGRPNSQTTQLNWTQLDVELSCVAINGVLCVTTIDVHRHSFILTMQKYIWWCKVHAWTIWNCICVWMLFYQKLQASVNT